MYGKSFQNTFEKEKNAFSKIKRANRNVFWSGETKIICLEWMGNALLDSKACMHSPKYTRKT